MCLKRRAAVWTSALNSDLGDKYKKSFHSYLNFGSRYQLTVFSCRLVGEAPGYRCESGFLADLSNVAVDRRFHSLQLATVNGQQTTGLVSLTKN
jgi:hypothetical protein